MSFNHDGLTPEQLEEHLSKIKSITSRIKSINEKCRPTCFRTTFEKSKMDEKEYDFIVKNIYEIECEIDEDITTHTIDEATNILTIIISNN